MTEDSYHIWLARLAYLGTKPWSIALNALTPMALLLGLG